MKVVALVSGGKDSCFTACEVVRRGHELVAMANLLPADEHVEDVDSFMFQTAGHGLIELLAACVAPMPMYRRRMRGSSHSVEMQYAPDREDEVEDLYALLSHVKRCHPQVNAVCSGAILSNFQRLRVEHVCERLGMTSLCYLWEREQTGLLREMIDAGVEAVLVKVAAMGLVPSKHLGVSLGELFPLLKKLESEYGCSVCGEGGEYETFVLDCPLFVNRIELIATEKHALSKDPIAPVGLLRVREARVVSKATGAIVDAPGNIIYCEDTIEMPDALLGPQTVITGRVKTLDQKNTRHYSSVLLELATRDGNVEGFFAEIAALLVSFGRALFVSVQTHDMSTFAAFNDCYKRFFPSEPPARAVWQPELRGDVLKVRAVFARGESPVKSHHVQSVSCWAPACIGPYSQAVTFRSLCWISGQIPLVPDTMLLSENQSLEMCVKHARAVGKSQGCRGIAVCLAYFVGPIDLSALPRGALCLAMQVAALPRGAQFEAVCIAEVGNAEYRKESISAADGVRFEMSRAARGFEEDERGEKDLVFVLAKLSRKVDVVLPDSLGTLLFASHYCVDDCEFPGFDQVVGLEEGVVAVSLYCFEQ
jgi:diphthine-ammonia ligase